ncbi:hypothetical protein ACQPZ8_02320 [Actinomadura nitritigenes]|uniref:hypothetical protein n=1 Tax=Actinomadura nitritigenes TaxID=134602 RepID=UPI003D8B5C46
MNTHDPGNRSPTIIAAIVTATGAVIAAVCGAVVTGGFGLLRPPQPTPSPTVPAGGQQVAGATPPSGPDGAAKDVPSAFLGSWQGTAVSNGATVDVGLYVQQGATGGYIGSFQIPVAGCRSDVTLTEPQAMSIKVHIEVKSGACVSGDGLFVLQSDVLRYRALGADGQLIDGSLHRS